MPQSKKYVLLTRDLDMLFRLYKDADVGRLLTMMLQYVNGEEVTAPPDLAYAWPNFKEYVDTQDKYLRHDGERHWNWKGGITPDNARIRASAEYAKWRKAVFERDHFTCQMCGRYGCKLNAHHIKPFSKYPEYRLCLDNGITLCKECHKKVHKKVK